MLKGISTVALVFLVGVSFAQHKNVKIDEASLDGRTGNPSVALSRKDQSIIYVTGLAGGFYASKDKGITWQKSKLNSAGDDPLLLSDSKGNAVAIQSSTAEGKPRQIVYSESADAGKSWSSPVSIGGDASKDQTSPSATYDTKGNLVVAWTQFDKFMDPDSLCTSSIYFSSSSSGKKWSRPVELSQTPGNCLNDDKTVTGPAAAVGPDGKMFVAWYSGGKLLMDRSFASGMWIVNDIVIHNQSIPFNLKISGHDKTTSLPQIEIDQSKGTYHGCLYVTWADERNGAEDSDVWFTRSNNHGDNWSTPVRMGSPLPAKHQYAPKMTVDQVSGYIYILFYDRGEYEDDQTDVYLSYSSDSGASFKAVKVSESPFTADDKESLGFYLDVSAHNGVVVPVWTRVDNGTVSLMTTTVTQNELVKPVEAKPKKKK